ncbi:AP2 domain-containing protein, partial [Helicobacter pylori]|uniref:AP2 domain-containing protein n=1 Tax=Helicobacter pylori TaxID=210 RepID=UPI0029277563
QNNANQKRAKHNSKSGHKGVYWHKAAQKWCAEVVCDYKKYYLGVFENKLDAVEAYNAKAKELYGDFFSKS